jgi:hypothetical protein
MTKINENKERMFPYKKGNFFVSHIDILGFTSYIKQNSLETLENVLLSMFRVSSLKEFYQTGDSNFFYTNYDQVGNQVSLTQKDENVSYLLENNFINFSDSIVMYVKESEDKQITIRRFKTLCKASNLLISKLILDGKSPEISKFALRCGIAYGPGLVCNELKVYTGQSFVDAYQLCDHQEWMGGAIHPNVPSEYCEPLVGYNNELFPYQGKIPIYKDCTLKPQYALNWVNSHHSIPPFYKENDKFREGPLLLDVGGHIVRFKWESKENYAKANNTLNFVVAVDKEWNKNYNLERSTPVNFTYPSWYKPYD